MELHYGVMSGNSARAVFCLFESKAEWKPLLVDTRGGKNRRQEYLARNPMGKVPSFIDELARYLPVLESALNGKQWLEGEFSLADIAYTPHFMMIKDGGFDFSPYPNISAWYERLAARQTWKATYDLVFAPVMGRDSRPSH